MGDRMEPASIKDEDEIQKITLAGKRDHRYGEVIVRVRKG